MNHDTYWRTALTSGITTIPSWSTTDVATVEDPGRVSGDPRRHVAEREVPVPESLVTAVRRVAGDHGVPERVVWLAAHVAVLATLSGDGEVTTGYRTVTTGDRTEQADQLLPAMLDTTVSSWSALLRQASAVDAALLEHETAPIDELRRDLGLSGSTYPVVVDPADPEDRITDRGHGGELPDGVVLAVARARRTDGEVLRLRYRTDVMDSGYAERVAGYHLTALAALAADPEAAPSAVRLVGTQEARWQREDLAGRARELPECRAHELFERQVDEQPDAIAAVHGEQRWTYRQLNDAANRVGRALLARGLAPEQVVGAVLERNLDWMATVLGIIKAGGAYLPIEPHFPADRIRTTLRRADCHLVVTETDSRATLDAACADLPDVTVLEAREAYREGSTAALGDHPGLGLGVTVGPDQLAYLYFTSGSTGEPKGAMCEQAGMLNHLFAKIDDLGIDRDTAVAQTAPQCFDISLWQLIAALLVGGRTVIVPQDDILDVRRFLDTLARERVDVAQLVPSYLDVVVSYLNQTPVDLPQLRCVSATGEALKPELVHRWFAMLPQVPLVNAYGLTETSDDTNHEVMHEPPAGDRMPLGRPISNVVVYLLDEELNLVPAGAPGLIAFSGVCVGRGYINDPDRTKAAYLEDPFRPGERLYLSGDYGRWRPDGKLEFLGRRDNQVKVSGFRIEIGEIENTLLRIPGVGDGAVVVAERPNSGKHLVGYYSGPAPLDPAMLRDELSRTLPDYMVPRVLHWRDRLPLTANGKIDRRTLTALADADHAAAAQDGAVPGTEPGVEPTPVDLPTTATERALAEAWARVLGIPVAQVGRRAHFFDLGGTSLIAVKLAIALKRALTLHDIVHTPVLAEMAEVLDGTRPRPTPADPLAALATTSRA